MRFLKAVMLYAFTTSCATHQDVYNVTHMINETDSAVNVWSSESFPLTNFVVATDTIYWFELSMQGVMEHVDQLSVDKVIEITDSTLIIGDDTKRTTYLINKL
jgi:hypothetical protein